MVSLHFEPYPTPFYLTAFKCDFTAQKLRAFPFFGTNAEIALSVFPAKPLLSTWNIKSQILTIGY